jgi:OOP family OmpA-OmpF porin
VRALTLCLFAAALLACGGPADRGGGAAEIPVSPAAVSDPAARAEPEPSGGALEPQPTPPPDADRDAVPDEQDQCPNTRAGLKVDEHGCLIDADGDGVIGAADLCPDSPYGEPVDETGCRPRLAVAQEFTLLLLFEPSSAKIVGDPHGALAEVAALITQYPETTVVIEGHTDDRGPAKANMKMSKARADAVAKVLIDDMGIDAARVTTKGFGKTRPIATNATKEGRERNRRVVAVVMPGPAPARPETAATDSTAAHKGP